MAKNSEDRRPPHSEDATSDAPASETSPEREEGIRSARTPSEEFTDEPVVSDESDDPSDSG